MPSTMRLRHFRANAFKDGHTTVLRGFLTVPRTAQHELHVEGEEAACNITTVDGIEVWRREPGQAAAKITPMSLQKGKRHAFQTIFFGKPGKDFRVPQVNQPGTLETVMAEKPRYAFLKEMKENGVIINDLNAEVRRQGLPKGNNVHEVGNLTPLVTKTIENALAARKENTKPLPRVLMIGDSITGTYLGGVTKNLDGKAVVSKNPGNAEDTWNGLQRIDQWLDLKTYLQSGQEYLEMVNAVNDSLAQLPRFLPSYQNQGCELAGMVWFHGIADSQSPAQKAAYEKNLPNLIRDLRRDLKAPDMPVVVAAVTYDDGKIHAAQMGVGDPSKYPEFSGNVKSVDTTPFFQAAKVKAAGGYATVYYADAEAFLEIGEAMGKAMLELQQK